MSKSDSIKEEIGWLKLVFGALVAVDVSLMAWLAQNYRTADTILVVLCFLAIVVVTVGIIGVNRYAIRRISKLEKL